jgi:hypothetical protein
VVRHVCDEFHQGLAQTAKGLHSERNKAIAARTIPSIEGGLVCIPPCGCAAVGLRRHRAVRGGSRVDDGDVTHELLPLKREQQVSTRPCRWPQARRLRVQHGETGLLHRRNRPPPQRATHNVHDFIMAQHAQLMGGTAGEGVLSVCRAELSTAKARSGWGSMGEVGLPKVLPQGGPEVAIRET